LHHHRIDPARTSGTTRDIPSDKKTIEHKAVQALFGDSLIKGKLSK